MATIGDRVPDALPVLALAAAGLALLVPSSFVAANVDVLLAALVLCTAIDIDPGRLPPALGRWRLVIGLALAPLIALTGAAWAVAQFVHGVDHVGVIALGVAPTEVASVGLIGLMAGPAELAIAVLTVSLVLSAVLGPPLLVLLAGGGQTAHVLPLLGRFALVVIVPLTVGLLARAARPGLVRAGAPLPAISSLLVVALIYASLSGTRGSGLATAAAAGGAFLAISALIATTFLPFLGHGHDRTLALTIGMRDFAVAATLAAGAAGAGAARVAGVYGVLMLVAGASLTGVVRSRARQAAQART